MEAIYIIKGLDCANCANKLEAKINKIDGVNETILNFMTKKLILQVDNESILNKIVEICINFEDGIQLRRIK